MSSGHLEFESRIRRLLRKHTAMTQGYTTRMRPDGLIVAYPRRAPRPISGRAIVMFLGAFVLFKGVMVVNLGPVAYDEKVDRLGQGSLVEQAGAFAMQADPLTALVAQKLETELR